MDIRQLEIFLAVLENSGVNAASLRLGITPGAVSQQVQNLARELRTDLFVRSGKRLQPTVAGLNLAEQARSLMHKVREIEESFGNEPGRDTRPLHIATGATTLIYNLGRPFRRLRRKFPHAQIQITVSSTEEMVAGILDRKFDLAIISLPYSERGLRILPLFEEEMLIIRPSANLVRGWHVGNVQPGELQSAPFVLYPPSRNMRLIIDYFFRELGITPRVVMEADDNETMKGLVECGFGYSILPEHALRRPPRYFQPLRVRDRRAVRIQAIAMAADRYPRALAETAARFLESELKVIQAPSPAPGR